MRKYLVIVLIAFTFLAACGNQQQSTPSTSKITDQSDPSIYTELGNQPIFDGVIYRMDDGKQICYLAMAGTGVSISCPTTRKAYAQKVSDVIIKNVETPHLLNGGVIEMQDGDQHCYIMRGGLGLDLSCP